MCTVHCPAICMPVPLACVGENRKSRSEHPQVSDFLGTISQVSFSDPFRRHLGLSGKGQTLWESKASTASAPAGLHTCSPNATRARWAQGGLAPSTSTPRHELKHHPQSEARSRRRRTGRGLLGSAATEGRDDLHGICGAESESVQILDAVLYA